MKSTGWKHLSWSSETTQEADMVRMIDRKFVKQEIIYKRNSLLVAIAAAFTPPKSLVVVQCELW
jgi:hypothetical protein